MLRTAVSMLSLYDPLAGDMSPEANALKAVKLMAQTATIVSTFDRLRNGPPVIGGDPNLSFAANFLYTLTGKRPDDVMERVFDVALILHADHELNASTFAARVTAATLSDIYSSITSAIGALKGPLHGGANQDVIQHAAQSRDAGQRRRATPRRCWPAKRRFRASAIACTAPRIRAPRICACFRKNWASAPAT